MFDQYVIVHPLEMFSSLGAYCDQLGVMMSFLYQLLRISDYVSIETAAEARTAGHDHKTGGLDLTAAYEELLRHAGGIIKSLIHRSLDAIQEQFTVFIDCLGSAQFGGRDQLHSVGYTLSAVDASDSSLDALHLLSHLQNLPS